MKKKLNLLWNLKFNFFSVAERPLTFFAYFLNAKKVGRRRLVISPAKAGAFLFSHTRLPFPPRPLLPFGRISPAAKLRVRYRPHLWVCRAKAGAAFRCAKPPCAVVRFAAMASPPRTAILPFPSRLRRAGAPTAKPRRLSPFGSISPPAKPRNRSLPPPGAACSPPFSLPSNVAPRSHPGACRRSAPFRLRRNAQWSLPPFNVLLPHFRSPQMWPPALAPRRLSPFGSISPPAKTRATGRCPRRGNETAPHFRSPQMWPRARTPAQPVLFIGQKMRYSVLAGFSVSHNAGKSSLLLTVTKNSNILNLQI